MSAHLQFRIPTLRQFHRMLERRIVREAANAQQLRLLEPAPATFDAPATKAPNGTRWADMAIGDAWGGKQQWAWMAGKVTVPASWKAVQKTGAIELHIAPGIHYLVPPRDDNFPAGPEGQVFINGVRAGAIDHQHHSIRWPFAVGQTYDIRVVFFAARCACRHTLDAFEIQWVDLATEKLFHDLRVALDQIDQLDETSVAREKLIAAVTAALKELDLHEEIETVVPQELHRDPAGELVYQSVTAAQRAFDRALHALAPAGDVPNVTAVGMAHIDLGWLWPTTQAQHKCVRTFATQCRLLEQYPFWVFQQSSGQAYQWVQRAAPDLFAHIQKLVNAGRWEADGATWVEMDTNVTSGESLVRQLLYGKRFFKEQFGVDSRMLWLPDVFGYSAALPQLLRLAEVDSFVTSKISWSQYNRFPFDTFRWRGIDGSEIPTHFITTPDKDDRWLTYNAMVTVREMAGTWKQYRQKDLGLSPLVTFGFGDGGGGPTPLMLETGTRLATLPSVATIPCLRFEPAGALMKRVVARAPELPVWDGELYLELHRGTYTTQAWIKRANRKNEIALHNVEWLRSLAGPQGYKLDKGTLDSLWQDLMLLQFHDILPGSSVGELYAEVRPMHQRIADTAGRMTHEAAQAIVGRIDTSAFAEPVVLFNTLSWDRRDPVRLADGRWIEAKVPATGWTVVEASGTGRQAASGTGPAVSDDGRKLDNAFWSLRLDRQGQIVSLFDKRNDRQVLAPGLAGQAGNQWRVYEDRPMDYDAWDIDLSHEDRPLPGPELTSIVVVERGPVRSAVELTWTLPRVGSGAVRGVSTITQRIALYADHPRIDFETQIDWHEHHQLLKVAFPVDVRATEATYQIQFGHLRRPTHRNTSWDVARFEVCAHQFADLSEHGYGVALLNDCKYGHSVRENVMQLTCIKSPQSPDGTADQGHHEFTYALLPHAGSFQDAGVIQAAAEMNTPVIAVPLLKAGTGRQAASGTQASGTGRQAASGPQASGTGRQAASGTAGAELPATYSFVRCDHPAVIVETIKPAEDGEGLILRLYEAHGSHARAALTLATEPGRVSVVNLLEEPMKTASGALRHTGREVHLTLTPFQIVTLRVE